MAKTEYEYLKGYTSQLISNMKDILCEEDGKTPKNPCKNVTNLLQHEILQKQTEYFKTVFDFTNAEFILETYRQYVRLTAELNEIGIYPASRTGYCVFVGMNTAQYVEMASNSKGKIRMAFQTLEDYFIGVLQSGALSGSLSSSAAKSILQTDGIYGHSQAQVKKVEPKTPTAKNELSTHQINANIDMFMIDGD